MSLGSERMHNEMQQRFSCAKAAFATKTIKKLELFVNCIYDSELTDNPTGMFAWVANHWLEFGLLFALVG